MVKSKFKIVLIVLLIIVTILDSILALRTPFLEANPLVILMGSYGWGVIIFLKFLVAAFLIMALISARFKNEKTLFNFSATILVLLVLWGYGAYLSIDLGGNYITQEQEVLEEKAQEIEENTGVAPSPQEMEAIQQNIRTEVKKEAKKIAIPYYTKLIWILGIYPFIFSLVSFSLYEKLLKSAKFKKPRQRQSWRE